MVRLRRADFLNVRKRYREREKAARIGLAIVISRTLDLDLDLAAFDMSVCYPFYR